MLAFLLHDSGLLKALEKGKTGELSSFVLTPNVQPSMRPVGGPVKDWKILEAIDFPSLACGLDLYPDDLGWFTTRSRKKEHYHYRWHKKGGERTPRLIEIPKSSLKQTQRTVLEKIFSPMTTHEASCGFQVGKSVFDFVRPHCGQKMVLKLDLEDFFPGITSARIIRLFLTVGYPEYVADFLTRLCTNRVPELTLEEVNLSASARSRFEKSHLPQGAPSSPALANLCAFRLDCRLAGLARSVGVQYTRYADDLLFSGGEGFSRCVGRFYGAVLRILITEEFRVNLRKTRLMPSSQRQMAAGLILNEKPNVARREYDQLKAILQNCRQHDWQSQNREKQSEFPAHLAGRIKWVAASNPNRGRELSEEFAKIDW